jgi:broad specificity phosphatase PhoE
MKTLEIRRHSLRSQPHDHLNQEGVALARSIGQNIGPFDLVITSKMSRALETAVAMGFAVDEQNTLMSSYGKYDVDKEVPWPQPFSVYAAAMQANGPAAKYARKLAKYYEGMMDRIANGRAALTVHHGGVVEIGVVACLPQTDFESWGGPIDYCEGVRMVWDDGKFIKGEVLRIPK